MADTAVATAPVVPAAVFAPAAPVVVKAPPRPHRVLHQNFGIDHDGLKSRIWYYKVPPDHTKEDLLRPEYFADVAEKVSGHSGQSGPGDLMRFYKPDTGWSQMALIDDVGKGFIRLRLSEQYVAENVAPVPQGKLTVRWNVGKQCHEVIRDETKEVVASGFKRQPDAVAWLNKHIQDLAA